MGTKPWNEDSGRFLALIDLERPEEQPSFLDGVEHVGAEIDAQINAHSRAKVCIPLNATGTYHGYMRRAARHYLSKMLSQYQSAATTARVVGLNRTHMHKLMVKLDIESPNPAHRGNWDTPLPGECTHPADRVQSGVQARGISLLPFCMACGEHLPESSVTVETHAEAT